jgi:hypothetical protein
LRLTLPLGIWRYISSSPQKRNAKHDAGQDRFSCAAWPVSEGANLALWIAGVFAALALWMHFRRSDGKLSD